MEKASLSPYRYLTFLLPGALVVFVGIYGWAGWPWGEPGAGLLLALSAASFMTGHVVVAVANVLQPVWFGHRPGTRLESSEGLFDKGARFAGDEAAVRGAFKKEYPQLTSFDGQFGAAYVEAQKGPLAGKLLSLVEEIGYYRSMAAGSCIAAVLVVIYALAGKSHLPIWPWLGVLACSCFAHAYRLKRFWRYVAEYVAADLLTHAESSDARPVRDEEPDREQDA